jgi:hypothetical protein
MATDFRDYFNNRISQELENRAQIGISDKYDSLQAASRQKAIDLNAIHKERLLVEARNRESWVGKLGIDADSPVGKAVNLGASLYSGAARQVGNLVSLAPAAVALADESSITAEEMAAYNRVTQGLDTPEDLALLNRKKAFYSENDTPQAKAMAQAMADRNPDTPTVMDVIGRSVKARQMGRSINEAFDQSSVVNSTQRDRLTEDLGADFESAWNQTGLANTFEKDKKIGGAKDLITGVARLIYNAGEAAVTNPGAASEYIVENLPQLAGGLFGKAGKVALTSSNASYAADNYQKGLEKYALENGGAFPPAEERQRMALYAASTMAAEQLGELGQLGAIGKIRKAADAGEDAARIGFKQSVLNTGKAVGKGAVGEGLTEGYQTFAEGEAQLKPASALDVYIGSTIGAVAGAGTSGGGRAIAESLGATPEKQAKKAADATKAQTLKKAIDTGDITELTDPKSPNYSPADAVAALYGNTQVEGATEETKQKNFELASQVVADLEERFFKVREAYQSVSFTTVETYKERLKQAQADGDTELAAMLQEELKQIENDDASRARLSKQSSDLTEKLAKAHDFLARFNEETQSKDLDVNAEAAKIDNADPVASQAAATSIINLSMAIPERLDVSLATQLADNSANALTVPQRAYLRAFSAAREAENLLKDLGKVSQEIFFGSDKNVGIAQYRERMASALNSGNKRIADKQLTDLSNFALDHQAKADTAAIALQQFESTGTPVQMLSNGNRGWTINTGAAFTEKELRKQGGVQIDARSRKLVENFQKESDALNKAEAELRSAYDIKFGGGSTNVSNVSQTLPSTQTTSNPATTQTTAQASGSSAGVAAQAGSSTTVGETENVNEAAQTQQAEAQGSQVSATDAGTQANAGNVVTEEAPASSANAVSSASTEASASGVQSNDESTATSDDTTESGTAKSSGLSILDEKSPEGTSFQSRNLIADYFNQSSASDNDTTQRPLAAVGNFLSEGFADVMSFLPSMTMSSAQQNVLSVFKSTASQWQSTIQANLVRSNPNFRYTDMMQFLIKDVNGKLDLDENVKTAMSYAGFTSVIEMASRSMYNTDEEINAILDRDESTMVSEEERTMLALVGTRQNLIANALGARAVQALGLRVNPDAPLDMMPKLESALGAHIMKMLMDQGILERTTISGAEMARLTNSAATDANAQFQFIRLARNDDSTLVRQAEDILQAGKGTQGILDKLFGVESAFKEPTLEPVEFTQKTTRNTNQRVPEKLAKIIDQENKVANFIRQDMVQLVTQLSEEVVLAIAGAQDVSESTHATNVIGINAKKDGLKREYDRFIEFVNGMADSTAAIYFEHIVWKQQRVGISTNAINPQTSKIHRHMLYRKSWETKVEFSNAAQMDNFRLRVLEGLGVKTDKQSNEASLAMYDSRVKNDVIQDAVEVLRTAIFEGGITSDGQQTLLAAVKQGGENFQTLDALVALAHEAQAARDNQASFTVQMMNEVDGVTNGPMLSHLLLGAGKSVANLFGLLNRGGFFEQGNPASQYNQWRGQPGNQDLYEITAQHMVQGIQDLLNADPKMGAVFDAVFAFTGDLRENTPKMMKKRRDIVKKPLTSMVFGSAVGKAVSGMADLFVESIYTAFEEIGESTRERQPTIDHINTLLIMGKGPTIKSMSSEELQKFTFSPAQVKALKKSFETSVGKSLNLTMLMDFGSFMDRRTQMNDAAQLSFDLYNAVYTGLYDAYVQELVAAGEIAVNSKGTPLHALTGKQDAELRKRVRQLMPMMHTPMSSASGSLGAGLLAAKSERTLSTKSTYSSEVKFGTPFADNNARSTKTNAFETMASGPGVAMVVMSTHSADSAISHTAAEGNEVLNVHDAHGSGLAGFAQTARNLNAATWGTLLNYSPVTEMSQMLQRTILGLAGVLKQDNLPPAVIQNVKDVIERALARSNIPVAEVSLNMLIAQNIFTAYRSDQLRLEMLASMQSIDQYALEGGNYVVTDEDRAQAQALLAGLTGGVPRRVTEALGFIAEVTKTKKTAETEMPAEVPAVTSVFGEIGTPTIQSDSDLVSFFQGNPQATVAQVFQLLSAQGRLNAINRKILGLVIRTVSPDLKIRFITPETSESDVLQKATTSARGWYVAMGSAEEIYVLNPQFKDSGLTAETLLHELVHAAIAKAIASPSAEGRALVEELEALRLKAQEYATRNGLTQYAAALKDVQEFVAWGMTNFDFQKDVLSKIQMESKTGSNVLVTGMKKFIDTLSRLLFKKPDENLTNGLTVLISNVSGLFNEVGQARKTSDVSLNLAQANAIDAYTTLEIHQALDNGSVSPEFSEHLGNLLGGIVQKLHGPFGAFAAGMRKTEAGNPLAVWLKAIETGKAPFASKIVASGFAGSAQEDFVMQQVEATVNAALEGNEATTKAVYRELGKLYTEMRAKLKPSDFESQEDYDFVFKLESDMGDRSGYLARFAAMGLASEKFNTLLNVATDKDPRTFGEGKTLRERLMTIFEKILEFFNEKITHTYGGQPANSKLQALVEQLVDIEARKRHLLVARQNQSSYLAPVEQAVKNATDAMREKVSDFASSNFVRRNNQALVRGAGAVVRTIASDRVELALEGLQRLRDQQFKSRPGVLASLVTELKGPLERFNELLRRTKKNESDRKWVITQYSAMALQSFANNGKDLSQQAKSAIAAVVMRTGMHNLLDEFSMAEIESLVSDTVVLDKAIETMENRLSTKLKDRHIEQANGLGYFKATGKARVQVLMLNSHLIARMSGTPFESQITEQEAAREQVIIAKLATLYALKYSSGIYRSYVKDALRTENARTDGKGNGIEFVLKLHQALEAESLERLFKGNPALMIHGYTPDIMNPHTKIVVADVAEGKTLIDQGYSAGGKVPNDPSDPNGSSVKSIYVLRDGGLAPYLSGVFSLSSMQARGSKLHDGYLNVNNATGLENASNQTDVMNRKMRLMQSMSDPRRNMNDVKTNMMVPVFNEAGRIVNWRYVMQEVNKDTLLERDNRFENVMGMLAGSVYDKEVSAEQNATAIRALREQYEAEFATQKDAYIEVGARSVDPEMREIWNLLPEATRRQIRKDWGRDAMMVRKDSLDIMFGYRKLSLATMFQKDPEARNKLENLFVGVMETMMANYAGYKYGKTPEEARDYAKRAAVFVTRGERGWQELVREAKDIIVIKTGTVMLGNIWSNMSFLAMSGVSLKDILNHHMVAIKAATAYQTDTKRLEEIETMLNLGYTQGNEEDFRREMVRLKDAIARNPVRELIEAGLMPTIVEDVGAEEDPYSYKSLLARKTERFAEKINPAIRNVARTVYMAHDTPMYQTLNQITQLSDFVARYTLYQHLISRKDNPLSRADAIAEASDAFVNYDIPTHRSMQYADDMGVIMFTKYFLRIQRVLLKLARENPARVFGTVALNNFMDLGPIVLDSHFMGHIGNNPLNVGAFKLPMVLDDLATVKAAMAIVK